jgi:hypothetical protein
MRAEQAAGLFYAPAVHEHARSDHCSAGFGLGREPGKQGKWTGKFMTSEDQYKLHFALKNTGLGACEKLDGGMLVNIKLDPFELTPNTGGHLLWMKEKTFLLPLFGGQLNRFAKSLEEFPPRQKGTGIGAATLFNQKKY